MPGLGGALAGNRVGLQLAPRLLHAVECCERAVRLAHDGERVDAGAGDRRLRRPVTLAPAVREQHGGGVDLQGEAETVFPVFRGDDELGGDIGLGGVVRREGGDAGDDGVVAAAPLRGIVGERRRQGGAKGVDQVAIGVGLEQVGDGGVGSGAVASGMVRGT